jgi:hypothetical protein
LAALIEAKIAKHVPANKPVLRLVKPPPRRVGGMDEVTRESHLRMIRHLRRMYGLQVLVDQATFGRCSIEQLEDEEIIQLHADLNRARECGIEGISIEEAGLLRPRT